MTILSIEIPVYNSHTRPFPDKFLRRAELVLFLSSLPLVTSIHRFDGVLNNDPDATLNTNDVSEVTIRQIKSFQWQTEMCCISLGESQAIFCYKWARNLHALRAIPCTRLRDESSAAASGPPFPVSASSVHCSRALSGRFLHTCPLLSTLQGQETYTMTFTSRTIQLVCGCKAVWKDMG